MVAKKGPPSALETGKSGIASVGDESGSMVYAVQLHTADKGLEVKYVSAKSGDEAAQKVLAANNYKEATIRGVTPASDPDANSLGGERDAAQMISNAENGGAIINTLGTDANRVATEALGKADIEELKN
ncbi:MAG TPA: hypothetical protein VF638_01045 [Sphingomonas sp.]|jgi:hypothetical protein